MTLDDDELGSLLRAANPAPRPDVSLTAKDIALRESIIRGGSGRRPARRSVRWAGAMAIGVASVVVAAIVVGNVLAAPQQASALTPPALQYDNAESLDEVVADAHDLLDGSEGPRQESRVHSLMWAWNIDIAKEHVEVVPQQVTYEWSIADGSVNTVIAGESYWKDGDRPEGLVDSPYAPGDVISRVKTPASEFTIPASVAVVSGATSEDLAPVLEELGAPRDASSGEMLAAISLLMSYWTLTNEQHGTLIDMLIGVGGVTVLGETTDRDGRPVVGLRVTDDTSAYQDTVLVSQQTGRIVGIENELTEPMEFIPAGIVGYTLWDVG